MTDISPTQSGTNSASSSSVHSSSAEPASTAPTKASKPSSASSSSSWSGWTSKVRRSLSKKYVSTKVHTQRKIHGIKNDKRDLYGDEPETLVILDALKSNKQDVHSLLEQARKYHASLVNTQNCRERFAQSLLNLKTDPRDEFGEMCFLMGKYLILINQEESSKHIRLLNNHVIQPLMELDNQHIQECQSLKLVFKQDKVNFDIIRQSYTQLWNNHMANVDQTCNLNNSNAESAASASAAASALSDHGSCLNGANESSEMQSLSKQQSSKSINSSDLSKQKKMEDKLQSSKEKMMEYESRLGVSRSKLIKGVRNLMKYKNTQVLDKIHQFWMIFTQSRQNIFLFSQQVLNTKQQNDFNRTGKIITDQSSSTMDDDRSLQTSSVIIHEEKHPIQKEIKSTKVLSPQFESVPDFYGFDETDERKASDNTAMSSDGQVFTVKLVVDDNGDDDDQDEGGQHGQNKEDNSFGGNNGEDYGFHSVD